MMKSTTLLALVALATALGCATSTPAGPDGIAPPPFNAEQIRDATRRGRTYIFRLTQGDEIFYRRIRFVEVSDSGCTTEGQMLTRERATMGPATTTRATWAELVIHARYPADATTIERGVTVVVPAGTFESTLYHVRTSDEEGRPTRTRAWFAEALPGAPVKLMIEVDGTILTTMQLVEHDPGAE